MVNFIKLFYQTLLVIFLINLVNCGERVLRSVYVHFNTEVIHHGQSESTKIPYCIVCRKGNIVLMRTQMHTISHVPIKWAFQIYFEKHCPQL